MFQDQQPEDDLARKKAQQGEAFPPGLGSYRGDPNEQELGKNRNGSSTKADTHHFRKANTQGSNLTIPSFSQVMGGALTNVRKSGTSTPGEVHSPKSTKMSIF